MAEFIAPGGGEGTIPTAWAGAGGCAQHCRSQGAYWAGGTRQEGPPSVLICPQSTTDTRRGRPSGRDTALGHTTSGAAAKTGLNT